MAHITTIDGNAVLVDVWHIEDVREIPGAEGFTEKQCISVLEKAAQHHDATIGINWEVLAVWVEAIKNETV
jgi:hypothetical protein